MNKYTLFVMDKLKSNRYFFKKGTFLTFNLPDEGEAINTKTFSGLFEAVYELRDLGAVVIHNSGDERIPGTTSYEFELIIVQPAFDGIYTKCVREVANQNIEQHENSIFINKNRSDLLNKLHTVISMVKLGPKQLQLVKELKTFEPTFTEDLLKKIKTKDIKDLKKQVNKKLIAYCFYIKPLPRKNISSRSGYRLTYFPPTK